MYEEDIKSLITCGYWPSVCIENDKFIAKLYMLKKRPKGWRQIKNRTFKTPQQAWDYLKNTLQDTLKFIDIINQTEY